MKVTTLLTNIKNPAQASMFNKAVTIIGAAKAMLIYYQATDPMDHLDCIRSRMIRKLGHHFGSFRLPYSDLIDIDNHRIGLLYPQLIHNLRKDLRHYIP